MVNRVDKYIPSPNGVEISTGVLCGKHQSWDNEFTLAQFHSSTVFLPTFDTSLPASLAGGFYKT